MPSMISTPLPATGAFRSGAARFDPGYPSLLVHSRRDKLHLVAPVCADERLGAVICVPPKASRADLNDIIERFTSCGADPVGLMLDANRYSGKSRAVGTDGMSTEWVRAQSNAGIAHPLTNAGYVPEGEHDVLHAVLRASAASGDHVVAALPVANRYLNRDVDRLIDEINEAGVAVGLMVEHRDDPFGTRANVAGLIRLLKAAEVPILLLRCDLSVIGALAWGARAGAFGASTSLRHIYPVSKSKGGGRAAGISAMVKTTMSLHRLEKIDDAIRRMPDPTMWDCPCSTCYGRPLNCIATEDEAFSHSITAVSELANQVLDPGLSPRQRREQWQSLCHNAQFRSMEVDSETGGAWGSQPGFLGAWVAQIIDEYAMV